MNPQTDNELISRVLNGEHNLFSVLITRYKNLVFSIALKYAKSREDAEEVAQDAFIKAFKSLSGFRGDSKFSTWLFTITTTSALSFLRKKRPDIQSLDNEHVFQQVQNHDAGMNPDQFEHHAKLRMLNESIALLGAEDAQILTLFYKGDQSLEEIGRIMNLEANTVKVKLFRARQKLKERIEKNYGRELKEMRS